MKFPEHIFHKYIWVAASGNYIIVGTVINRVTARLLYTFRPDSITLDTKNVVKINYDVPAKSATKLKKYKVRNELIPTLFKQDFRQPVICITKVLEYSSVSSFKTCGF